MNTTIVGLILIPIVMVLWFVLQPKASRKIGSWKDLWQPEYDAGMLAGIGVGIFVASAFLPREHRVFSMWVFIFAFSCVFAGSTLASILRRRKNGDTEKP